MTSATVSDRIIAPDIAITKLTKRFGAVTVLHDIDLTIRGGEFIGLMGPNGAGKSTLIKILDGVYTATSGEIRLGGEKVVTLGGRADVGFIHQDLGLIDTLSISENLRLGEEPMRRFGPILDGRRERESAAVALERVGLDASVDTLVGELSPGEKTLVAVARVFARGARILFVDESTSTLPPRDAQRVIDSLQKVAGDGATVIMVSHKLAEILGATSRVVILLDGRLAADHPTKGLDRKALVDMLLQHEAARADDALHDTHVGDAASSSELLLEMNGAYGGRAGPVDLKVLAGEVVGLSGLPGSGLHDLAFLAHGSMRPTKGTVRRRDGLRVALVPPHRESQGGFGPLEVRQNLTISSLSRWASFIKMLAVRREGVDSAEMVKRLDIKPNRIDMPYGVLSGGNKQKVIFGRVMLQEPDLYVLCEPTRGVDVGTRSELYRLIRELRAQGAGVLIVSSDSEDLLAVCDRVAVITDGRLSEMQSVSTMDQSELETLL